MKRFPRLLNKLNQNEDAVVGVVVAVLLVGLLLAITLILQSVFVPNWMEQLEADHMDEVADQFAMLKFAVDLQSATEKNIPITTSITLGNKELPFLLSSRSFGFLRIVDDEYNITITNASNSYSIYPSIIKYSSENAYFIDKTFSLEAGAMVTSQIEGSVMAIKPNLYVDYDIVFDEVNITFSLTNISGVGGKKSVSGFGTYPIRTNFSNTYTMLITDIQNIIITTSFPTAWKIFINSTLLDEDLDYGAGDDYWITTTDESVTVNFNPPPDVDIFIEISNINAQIAPGWIE